MSAPRFDLLGVDSLAEAVRERRIRAVDLVRRAFERQECAEDGDVPLHAFLSLDRDGALATAERIDGGKGPGGGALLGMPVAVKDNLSTLALPTTCGSRMLKGYRAPFEATVVRRLRAAGAIVVGKTNLDEFAMGSSTENSAFGPTRNPCERTRVPGGSSGGSAAAVAAGIVPLALGSDTGGSVRQPAAFCGVVGIKPTWGRVSRYGLVAFASSLDQVGTFGATVADAARLLEVVAGPDPLDATTAARPVPALGAAPTHLEPGPNPNPGSDRGSGGGARLDSGLEGRVVGVPEEYYPDDLDPGVRRACDEVVERLRGAGARLRRVSLPHTRYAIPTYYLIAPAEASSNLARFDGVRFGLRPEGEDSVRALHEAARSRGFGAEVKRRIILGTFALSAGYHDRFYGRAKRVRQRIAADFDAVFAAGCDLLFTPTTPGPAFALGERSGDPYAMYLADVFTTPASLAGLPAVSLPIGKVGALPVGGQLIGPAWQEAALLRSAAALERLLRGEP